MGEDKHNICVAKCVADQKVCARCNQTWDISDKDPPKCKTSETIAKRYLAEMRVKLQT